jgi:RNA polymerase sigma-70 factor (ECF subfamily)
MKTAQEFDEFYRNHLHLVQKYLSRRVGFEQVEELSAEIFDIAYRRMSQAKLGFELPWLYRIAGFVVANHRRKLNREINFLALFAAPDSAASAEQLALTNLAIAEAWKKLKPAEAAALSLAVFEGLSIEEIAMALGVSKNAVNIKLHRARNELAKLLEL